MTLNTRSRRFVAIALGTVLVGVAITVAKATTITEHLHHRLGSVVGSDHPELIPDDMAYSAMLNTLAGQIRAPLGEARAESYLSFINRSTGGVLTPTDLDVIRQIAMSYDQRRRSIHSADRALTGNNAREEVTFAIELAFAELDKGLSPSAGAAVRQFLATQVKPNMKLLK
jgi:hypothetical protein